MSLARLRPCRPCRLLDIAPQSYLYDLYDKNVSYFSYLYDKFGLRNGKITPLSPMVTYG